MAHAVVAVKDPRLAKSRLAGILTSSERRSLNAAMLEDVLGAIHRASGIDEITLISDDPMVTRLASKYGSDVFSERNAGTRTLNDALAAACDQIGQRSEGRILIAHSDLPSLRASDLEAVIRRGAVVGTDVVLGPDAADEGTNMMLFSTDNRPALLFGANSFSRHRHDLRRRGLTFAITRRPGIANDVDTAADLLALFERRNAANCGKVTSEFLSLPEIADRLRRHRDMSLATSGMETVAAND